MFSRNMCQGQASIDVIHVYCKRNDLMGRLSCASYLYTLENMARIICLKQCCSPLPFCAHMRYCYYDSITSKSNQNKCFRNADCPEQSGVNKTRRFSNKNKSVSITVGKEFIPLSTRQGAAWSLYRCKEQPARAIFQRK